MANSSIGNSGSYRNSQSPRQQTTDASTTSETATTVTTTTTTNTTTTTTTTSTSPATVTTSRTNTTAVAVAAYRIPTPTLSVPDLPTDIIGCLIQHLQTRQSERDFAFDVRNFSLVSRRLNAKVLTIFKSPSGRDFHTAWALHKSEFQREMFSRDCTTKAGLPGRRKLNPFASGTRPPKALKELLKQGETLLLKFDAQGNQEPMYQALINWGKHLPLSQLTLSCDVSSMLMFGDQAIAVLDKYCDIITSLVQVFRNHPNRESLKVTLHLRCRADLPRNTFQWGVLKFIYILRAEKAVREIHLEEIPEARDMAKYITGPTVYINGERFDPE